MFEALVVQNLWGVDRVAYLGPEGRTRSLPVEWTDVFPEDPCITVAAGRAPFRLADLLALAVLVRRAGQGEASEAAP